MKVSPECVAAFDALIAKGPSAILINVTVEPTCNAKGDHPLALTVNEALNYEPPSLQRSLPRASPASQAAPRTKSRKRWAKVDSVAAIRDIVQKHFGVTDYDLDSEKRRKAWPRRCFRFLVVAGLNVTFAEAALKLGGADETVRESYLYVRDEVASDDSIRGDLVAICRA